MASARLWIPHAPSGIDVGTGTAWWVDAYLTSDSPFIGPPGRNWDRFVGTDDGAEFEWRTRDDSIREAGQAFASGKLTLDQALCAWGVDDWLELRSSQIDEFLHEEGYAENLSDEDRNAVALRELAVQVPGEHDWLSAYYDGDDRYIEDAARSLDLPPWGRVMTGEEGGMGSSYLQAFVVLDEGKTPKDLGEWLNEGPHREVAQ